MIKIKTVSINDNIFLFENEHTMQREYDTLSPNGNKISGQWVYRDKEGKLLDFDQYCNDLAERFSLELYNLCTH
jgi:hypothetical protein